jgi:hypothetical protein
MKFSIASLLCCCGLATVGLACLFAGMNPEWMPRKETKGGGGVIEGLQPPPAYLPPTAPCPVDPEEKEKAEDKRRQNAPPSRERETEGSPGSP